MNEIATSSSPTSDVTEIVDSASIEAAASISEAIQGMLEEFDVQPILFAGAGIARRYIGAPDWDGALQYALGQIDEEVQPYSYFAQKFADDKIAIGTAIADLVFEWAWSSGKNRFDPPSLKERIATFL